MMVPNKAAREICMAAASSVIENTMIRLAMVAEVSLAAVSAHVLSAPELLWVTKSSSTEEPFEAGQNYPCFFPALHITDIYLSKENQAP